MGIFDFNIDEFIIRYYTTDELNEKWGWLINASAANDPFNSADTSYYLSDPFAGGRYEYQYDNLDPDPNGKGKWVPVENVFGKDEGGPHIEFVGFSGGFGGGGSEPSNDEGQPVLKSIHKTLNEWGKPIREKFNDYFNNACTEKGNGFSCIFGGTVRDSENKIKEGINNPPKEENPLILDINGDGIELTSVEDGAYFDLDKNGFAEKTAFINEGNGIILSNKYDIKIAA